MAPNYLLQDKSQLTVDTQMRHYSTINRRYSKTISYLADSRVK